MVTDSLLSSSEYLCSSALTVLTKTPVPVLGLLGMLFPYWSYRKALPQSAPDRPQLLLDAISNGEPIYYFGVGSNLSRSYLEQRSVSGKKIGIISMEPCFIPGYRLAFNMRGVPPLEPAMGGLEPVSVYVPDEQSPGSTSPSTMAVSKPLKAYEKAECHGSLVKLSPEDYDLMYKSEGGGRGANQGYEEIIVTCIPYNKSHPPVQAVAFRVRNHARLLQDASPSKRYMTIIQSGAKELGLEPGYQKWLDEHPIQRSCSKPLKKLAVYNTFFHFVSVLLFKSRFPTYVQSRMLSIVYMNGSESNWMTEMTREVVACLILIPTASCGFIVKSLMDVTGKGPPGLTKFIAKLEEN